MNTLISTIKFEVTFSNRFRFDGKHFHFYSNDPSVLARINKNASETKHVYGVSEKTGVVSFICDKARFRDQLIDIVIDSKKLEDQA